MTNRTSHIKYMLLLAITLALCLALLPRPAHAASCMKKGAAQGWNPPLKAPQVLSALNAGWYYNWHIEPSKGDSSVPFVPMLHGRRDRLQDDLAILKQQTTPYPILLVVNEPEYPKQAEMTSDEVIALWPTLQSKAKRISSPATASGKASTVWRSEFLPKAYAHKLKMDFFAIHWYGPPEPQQFLNFVDKMHQESGLPIWITEFGIVGKKGQCPSCTPQNAASFLKTVLPELEKRDYVERYAWFTTTKGGDETKDFEANRLFNHNGQLTAAGQVYASTGNNGGPPCGQPQ